MAELGLRERKKRLTRAHIAATAARLFAERGYEHVTVADVAQAADVADQTVYNYFSSKRDLVFDMEEDLQAHLGELIRTRPAGTSPPAAVRDQVLAFVESIKEVPADQQRGGLDYLVAVSPELRRLSLEMVDHLADTIASAISDTTPGLNPELAKVQAIALAWVFQTITDESGRRKLAGQDPGKICEELLPVVGAIIDNLDQWLSPSASTTLGRRRRAGRSAPSGHR